jgi:hypothetical protein
MRKRLTQYSNLLYSKLVTYVGDTNLRFPPILSVVSPFSKNIARNCDPYKAPRNRVGPAQC